MQPFVPVRLKKALSFLRLRLPGGPVEHAGELPAARARLEATLRGVPLPPMRSVTDLPVPPDEDGGGWQGLIRLFEPEHCHDRAPLIVDVHGGGFTMGSVAAMQAWPMRLAASTGFRAATVEYRLAPEHKFPVGLQDVARAVRHLFAQADELGVDPERILLTGQSAGANLIVAATLLLRDTGHPLPCALMPIVGAFAPGGTDSSRRFAEPVFGLGGKGVERCLDHYLRSPEERGHPLVSPVLADLRDMPMTCLFSAALDPLFDDSFAFAQAMRAQGRECYLTEMLGVTHAGLPFGYEPAYYALMVHVIRTLLEKDAGGPGSARSRQGAAAAAGTP